MLQKLVRLVVPLFVALSVSAQAAPLETALDAIKAKDWDGAMAAARPDGPIAEDIVRWFKLRAGDGSGPEFLDFVSRNSDWPGMEYLREKSEGALADVPDRDVLAYFKKNPPQSGAGAYVYARALEKNGAAKTAYQVIKDAWARYAMDEETTDAYFADYPKSTAKLHETRLRRLLWEGHYQSSGRVLDHVSSDMRKLAEARIGLMRKIGDADALVAAVPNQYKNDPLLAHARFMWRFDKGYRDGAVQLILAHSPDKLGQPEEWANYRRYLARALMREKQSKLAYRVASQHGLKSGSNYADLEWISGYVALRQLRDARTAQKHFERFLAAVDTPISLGRGGYWLGRAFEAQGDKARAAEAYRFGAKYQTSFYGLLSAEKAGVAPDPALDGTQNDIDWRGASFGQSTVFQAGVLFLAANDLSSAERFFTHLSESLKGEELARFASFIEALQEPHLSVMFGKRAASMGITFEGPYYAIHPLARNKYPVHPELALAIARRESEFDQYVQSSVGARGLMQIMPRTAAQVAKGLGLPYREADLLADWQYNATLGTAYLAELGTRFNGNAVMIAAGYNAGPSRPERWAEENGDPRSKNVDIVDWIELIPFRETRNYVMRVTESLPIYRARLGRNPHPVSFSKELQGSTLLPLSP